ncbi:MAG: hypothetical protein M3237_18785 [Actinomycetota bacterium]|nr:hypothetical protein [Actinomycetota bacterium]
MTWLEDYWLDVLGWGGSALLVFSLLQARVLRFRTLNLAACLILLVFNAFIEVWPMVGMNAVLAAINVFFIIRLLREQHDEDVFGVIEVGTHDHYLRHVLATHAEDIANFQPDLDWEPDNPSSHAFVVVKGDETVGAVLLRADGDVARVQLDYVTPKYRDFSPGEFVWRRSGVLRERGFRRVVTPPGMVAAYYGEVGFRRDGDGYVLDL